MSLNPDRKNALGVAIATGTDPKMGKSSQTTLRLRQHEGRSSYTVLSRADGSKTAAGEYYYKSTGRPAPSRQFDRGPLVKKGAGDYTKTRDGKLSMVRKLLPDGTTQVTRLGKLYLRKESKMRCQCACYRVRPE